MENATQALLIAAGVLFAIILITFGVYMYATIHNMAEAEDLKLEQEQLVAFNKKYLAYNKSILYGADLETLSKTVDAEKSYTVTIWCILKAPTKLDENEYVYYYKNSGRLTLCKQTLGAGTYNLNKGNNGIYTRTISNKNYGLSGFDIDYWLSNYDSSHRTLKNDINGETEANSTLKFRKKMFKCTGVNYDSNGMISEMVFEEI